MNTESPRPRHDVGEIYARLLSEREYLLFSYLVSVLMPRSHRLNELPTAVQTGVGRALLSAYKAWYCNNKLTIDEARMYDVIQLTCDNKWSTREGKRHARRQFKVLVRGIARRPLADDVTSYERANIRTRKVSILRSSKQSTKKSSGTKGKVKQRKGSKGIGGAEAKWLNFLYAHEKGLQQPEKKKRWGPSRWVFRAQGQTLKTGSRRNTH